MDYKGQKIDISVADQVVVELKAVAKLPEVATAQTLSYLRATGLKRALLVNFGEKRLVDGIKRLSLCELGGLFGNHLRCFFSIRTLVVMKLERANLCVAVQPQSSQRAQRMSEQLTKQIIGAVIQVHRILGPGLLESIYEEALCLEMELREIPNQRQKDVDVNYKEA